MFRKLRANPVDYRLLIPLLLSTMLVQILIAVVRITTSYRAVELGLSIIWLGIIAAAFALLPIFAAVRVGRYIDRGHDARTAWIGSTLLVVACSGFVLFAPAEALMLFTVVLGVGHLMMMASQQLLCVRAAGGPRHMESVFGNYMVAGAIGQGIGPYVVGMAGGSATVPPTQLLFTVGVALAALSLLVAISMRPSRDRPKESADAEIIPVKTLLKVPGLMPVIVAGVIMVSASDIILIYVPLLGAERNIDVKDIGLLLTVRAAASMVARIFYARMVAAAGHWPLMIASTFACACTYLALAFPMPLAWMFVIMVVMGSTFGIAATLSITIVVDMTTAGARGTGNSLRIMANRIGQFALPFGAGLVAAASGLGGLFALLAASIAASAVVLHFKRPTPPGAE